MKISKKFLTGRLLYIVGLVLISFGVYGFYQRHQATKPQPAAPQTKNILNSEVGDLNGDPSENEIDINSNFKVAKDMPRVIRLQTIKADGFVQKVSVTKANAVAVPSNVHLAGWYSGSVKPGETGLSVIDGHVSGKYAEGIFKNLSKLKAKDVFEIEFGDGSIKKFEVISVKSLPEAQSANYLFTSLKGIDKQLNLITCGGKYDTKTKMYPDRVIVQSKFIPST